MARTPPEPQVRLHLAPAPTPDACDRVQRELRLRKQSCSVMRVDVSYPKERRGWARQVCSKAPSLSKPSPGVQVPELSSKKPSPRDTWLRLACLGTLCSALACAGAQLVEAPALVADYPRGPGSFCALNPEGCPPPPAPAQHEPVQDLESPANKQACLDACEAGGERGHGAGARQKAASRPAGACVTRSMSVTARRTALRTLNSEEVS